MNKKENQRVVLSKRLIREAFLKLLEKKNIRDISIRELCEKAGINRSTFYVHYGSQYDVLSDIGDCYIQQIAEQMEQIDSHNQEDARYRIEEVLRYAEENLSLSRMLLNNNLDESFTQRLFSLPRINELLEDALSQVEDVHRKNAYFLFAISGAYRLIQQWINEEERIPADREAEIILDLAGRVCR